MEAPAQEAVKIDAPEYGVRAGYRAADVPEGKPFSLSLDSIGAQPGGDPDRHFAVLILVGGAPVAVSEIESLSAGEGENEISISSNQLQKVAQITGCTPEFLDLLAQYENRDLAFCNRRFPLGGPYRLVLRNRVVKETSNYSIDFANAEGEFSALTLKFD